MSKMKILAGLLSENESFVIDDTIYANSHGTGNRKSKLTGQKIKQMESSHSNLHIKTLTRPVMILLSWPTYLLKFPCSNTVLVHFYYQFD